jgi:hypothetical protein
VKSITPYYGALNGAHIHAPGDTGEERQPMAIMTLQR